MEDYHYIPEEAYSPPHNRVKESTPFVEDESILPEVEQIVTDAFGDEYERDILMLHKERLHAERCGCEACAKAYNILLEQTCMKYVNNSGDR